MERFDRAFSKACERLAVYVGGTLLSVMVIWVAGNVFARYVLGIGGLTGTYEYVGVMTVPLVCLSLSFGWYKGSYLVVNILQMKLKGNIIWGFQFTFLLITVLCFAGVLFVGTFVEVFTAIDFGQRVGTTTMWSPQWPWKATIALGFFLLAIRNILDMITMVRTREVVSKNR